MNFPNRGRRLPAILLVSSLILPCLSVVPGSGADYGRVAGTVVDTQGTPLMGATVLLLGPVFAGSARAQNLAERVITDARGNFTVERLLPGWYSLRVTAATRLPMVRNGIRVAAGETAEEKFILSDIFAPVRFQAPSASVSNWGDDWIWILRTSATTRPILRYQDVATATHSQSIALKQPVPTGRCLIGMMPGSSRSTALAGDPGMGSILAYLRPLSEDSDLLVAGSMATSGLQASSVATAIRKNMMKGEPQELSLVVHQLSFTEGLPFGLGEGRGNLGRAQGVVASYTHTRRLSESLSVTAGLEVDYLNAARDVMTARPSVILRYLLSPSTTIAARYRTASVDGSGTLLERIGALNAFPRVTLRGGRLSLEEFSHTEVSFQRRLSKAARLEVAAFRDSFQNAAVYASGRQAGLTWLADNLLPSSGANGVILNAGDYRSTGLRAEYSRSVGSHVDAAFAYALGDALGVGPQSDPRRVLHAERSHSFAGKVAARVPYSKTQITTSYERLQGGRVTTVDPYGQADLQLQPFLSLQIRQPLPSLAFLPAHIEALADFRNLLGEGYAPMPQASGKLLLLTSAYRSFRGGFSVQF